MITETFVPAAGPEVHAVELDGEAVLLDHVANRLHHLNATATLVWRCIDGRAAVGEIADDLSEGLGVDRRVVIEDVLTVLETFRAEGLLSATR